jgi:hypothetical protein
VRCILPLDRISARTQEVARLLRPITPPGQRLACRPRWLDRKVVLCAYIGPEPTDPDPDEWRFATKIPRIRACYYERWLTTDPGRGKLYLERAYLHLFIRREQHSEEQVLALHCDPNEAEANKHFLYKAGPHIHMSTAESPLDRTHIALNVSNLSYVLRSVQEITVALTAAVKMVDQQVLGLY